MTLRERISAVLVVVTIAFTASALAREAPDRPGQQVKVEPIEGKLVRIRLNEGQASELTITASNLTVSPAASGGLQIEASGEVVVSSSTGSAKTIKSDRVTFRISADGKLTFTYNYRVDGR